MRAEKIVAPTTNEAAKPPDVRVLVLLRQEASRDEFVGALGALQGVNARVFIRPKNLTLETLRKGTPPHVLLLDIDLASADDLNLIGTLKNGDIPVVALVSRTAELGALKAIRAGANDVLLSPIDPLEAQEVLSRVVRNAKNEGPSALGQSVVFMHMTGGAGATTLAVNSANLLTEVAGKGEVGLIDFDIQFGNIANLLDLPASSPVQDIIDEPARLDRDMLEGMMAKHSSGVQVLTAPRIPLPFSSYTADTVTTLMQIARRRFRYVVADLPVALAPWTDAVLHEATVIYAICPPTVPAVHRLSQLLSLLRQEDLIGLPIKIVVNRHHMPKRTTDISANQFSKAVGRDVDHMIPNDYGLIALSQNQGKAAVQMKPGSAFATCLAEMLADDLGVAALKRRRRKLFFFGGT